MHPDDIKKISEENVKGEFICKGVEAQYLVVENDMFTLRIIPQNFVMTECGALWEYGVYSHEVVGKSYAEHYYHVNSKTD